MAAKMMLNVLMWKTGCVHQSLQPLRDVDILIGWDLNAKYNIYLMTE